MGVTTGIQNKNFVSYFAANLEVREAGSSGAWTRLASVRGVAANITLGNTLEIKADDNQLLKKYFKPGATITITDWIELFSTTAIETLLGGTAATVAASPVAVTTEIIAAAGVSKGDIYIMDYKNGDNTIVSSIVVDDNGTPLVLNTDYTVAVDTDGSITGTIGKSYIVFLTDSSANQVDVDYSYTPNASSSWTINIESTALPELEVRLIGYQPENTAKTRVWSISNTCVNNDITFQYVDVMENGDFGKSAIEFMANEGATVTFNDEVDESIITFQG